MVVDRFAYAPPDTPWITVGLTDTYARALDQETLIKTQNTDAWRIFVRIVPIRSDTDTLQINPEYSGPEAQFGGGFGFKWPGGR